MSDITPFKIEIPDSALEDLNNRPMRRVNRSRKELYEEIERHVWMAPA